MENYKSHLLKGEKKKTPAFIFLCVLKCDMIISQYDIQKEPKVALNREWNGDKCAL